MIVEFTDLRAQCPVLNSPDSNSFSSELYYRLSFLIVVLSLS